MAERRPERRSNVGMNEASARALVAQSGVLARLGRTTHDPRLPRALEMIERITEEKSTGWIRAHDARQQKIRTGRKQSDHLNPSSFCASPGRLCSYYQNPNSSIFIRSDETCRGLNPEEVTARLKARFCDYAMVNGRPGTMSTLLFIPNR